MQLSLNLNTNGFFELKISNNDTNKQFVVLTKVDVHDTHVLDSHILTDTFAQMYWHFCSILTILFLHVYCIFSILFLKLLIRLCVVAKTHFVFITSHITVHGPISPILSTHSFMDAHTHTAHRCMYVTTKYYCTLNKRPFIYPQCTVQNLYKVISIQSMVISDSLFYFRAPWRPDGELHWWWRTGAPWRARCETQAVGINTNRHRYSTPAVFTSQGSCPGFTPPFSRVIASGSRTWAASG